MVLHLHDPYFIQKTLQFMPSGGDSTTHFEAHHGYHIGVVHLKKQADGALLLNTPSTNTFARTVRFPPLAESGAHAA